MISGLSIMIFTYVISSVVLSVKSILFQKETFVVWG